MKQLTVSRRSVLALLFAALAVPASGHSLEYLEQDIIQSEKYFQPEDKTAPGFTLQDADGKLVSLSDFRGKIVVLHFIYTNCPDFCPLHAEKLAQVQKMVNITPMKSMVQFISVTTDPSRDKGQVLKDFGTDHGLDPVNWIFLTNAKDAAEDSIRKLTLTYGVEFKPAVEGDQMHGVVTMVIDHNGKLVGRFHSLRFENLNLVNFVNALTNHQHRDSPAKGFWARMWDLI